MNKSLEVFVKNRTKHSRPTLGENLLKSLGEIYKAMEQSVQEFVLGNPWKVF